MNSLLLDAVYEFLNVKDLNGLKVRLAQVAEHKDDSENPYLYDVQHFIEKVIEAVDTSYSNMFYIQHISGNSIYAGFYCKASQTWVYDPHDATLLTLDEALEVKATLSVATRIIRKDIADLIPLN